MNEPAGQTNSGDLAGKVCGEIAKVLRIPVERVSASASLTEDLGADSLAHVSIVMGVEKLFNRTIPDEVAVQFVFVRDVIEAVRSTSVE